VGARSVAAALAAVLLLTVSACGSSGSDEDSSDDAASTTAAATGDGPTECAPVGDIPPAEGKPTTIDAPSEPTTGEVQVTVLEEGDGPEVTDATYVTVDYVGVSCTSGEQFDASWDRGAPITIAMPGVPPTETAFPVIPGWNQGLVGQKQGSLVQLDIPSDLAYGPAGNPPAIAANDPLTFVIQINEVSGTAPAP
jgi:peptidylprolyl isomerase